jgi:predicted  nucleic acid-binding Zn-ribbon protein
MIMNSKDKNGETSTFEMENKENFNRIIDAISGLRQDFNDKLENLENRQNEKFNKLEIGQTEIKQELAELKNYVEVQFEAVRQGVVKNYNQFDRLESQISENRAVIYSTKAMVGELHERVYILTRSTENSLK